MREVVIFSFFIVCFLFLTWSLYYFILLDKKVEKRVNYYFDIGAQKRRIPKEQYYKGETSLTKVNEAIRKKLSNIDQEKVSIMLRSAGVNLSSEEYIMSRWFLTATFGGVLCLIFNSIFPLIPGGIIGYLIPNMWLRKKIKLRTTQFNEGLPDMIITVIASLRSGYSFAQAFKTVVEECDAPVREEIALLLKELNYGITMEDALNNLNSRVPSADLELLVQAVLIQRQVGGNLAGVLEIILETIRERNRIQRQVQTLTAQGRLSGRVIGGLPVALGGMIYLINPEYMKVLFTNPVGLLMIGIGIVSGLIGFILINKLTEIEV